MIISKESELYKEGSLKDRQNREEMQSEEPNETEIRGPGYMGCQQDDDDKTIEEEKKETSIDDKNKTSEQDENETTDDEKKETSDNAMQTHTGFSVKIVEGHLPFLFR